MNEEHSNENSRQSPYIQTTVRESINIAATGAVVGGVVWAVHYLLTTFVLDFFCSNPQSGICASTPTLFTLIGLVAGGTVGLLGLIKFRAFRPLFVVLAVLVALGGISSITENYPWYMSLLFSIVFFSLGFSFFAWISRIRSLLLTFLIALVVVVFVRLALYS